MRIIELQLTFPSKLISMIPKNLDYKLENNILYFYFHTKENVNVISNITNYEEFTFILSKYLYESYVEYKLTELGLNDETLKNQLMDTFSNVKLLQISLECYLGHNNVFKEHIFFKFNMNMLGKDILKSVNKYKSILSQKKIIDSIAVKLDTNLSIADYSTALLDFDEAKRIVLQSYNTGDSISIKDLEDKIDVNLMSHCENDWDKPIYLCVILLLALDTKILFISSDLEDMLFDMKKNSLFQQSNIRIEIIESK